ncbi:hypothetical protein [Chitinimonas koreensis]|uniref:hypothetical protein n=1 Tax=Chitinimonas koreensis TaxID=356302 RepID=UPI0004018354|nr:hypothetical protein [Chitinimonas koreensis]QNM95231.1 hypothetical protein H9L41_15275 [Chitinimonas koreensis]
MLAKIKTDDRASAIQDRVQQHYGRVVRAGDEASRISIDQPGSRAANDASAQQSWQQALTAAMDRSTALMSAQAQLQAREAELARREQQLTQREQASRSGKDALLISLLFPRS